MTLPATGKAARAAGATHYFTGKPCIRGHIAKRLASTHVCVECGHAASIAWQKANPDYVKQKGKSYYIANREALVKKALQNQAARPEIAKAWAANNRDSVCRASSKWAKANPDKVNANIARRRAAQIRATPAWANRERIAEIYRVASLAAVEVDHVAPLRGKTVCGLHTEANMQLLPEWNNAAKGNRHWPDMWT